MELLLAAVLRFTHTWQIQDCVQARSSCKFGNETTRNGLRWNTDMWSSTKAALRCQLHRRGPPFTLIHSPTDPLTTHTRAERALTRALTRTRKFKHDARW